jgi:hypothetical protein
MPHGSMPPPPGAVPAPPGPHPGVPAEMVMPPGKKRMKYYYNVIVTLSVYH